MGEFINVTNFKVVNNIAKKTNEYNIRPSDIVLILGVRVTFDGKSTTLFDVRNNSGSICITDDSSLRMLLEYFGPMEPPINTYTVINGIGRPNDTRYVNYSTINRMTSIKSDKRKLYECTSPLNVVIYNTDEEGFQRIYNSTTTTTTTGRKTI